MCSSTDSQPHGEVMVFPCLQFPPDTIGAHSATSLNGVATTVFVERPVPVDRLNAKNGGASWNKLNEN